MALPKAPNFKVYDPRRGEEWEQEVIGGRRVSLREHAFLVIDYWPGRRKRLFELDDFDELIQASIAATGALGFVSVAPFTKQLKRNELVRAAHWNESSDSAICYFGLTKGSIRQHLALLRLATYEDCVIGSCSERLDDVPKRRGLRSVIDWNIEFLFTQVGKSARRRSIAPRPGSFASLRVSTSLWMSSYTSLAPKGTAKGAVVNGVVKSERLYSIVGP